jgi:N-terminal domain on NACHT_NTPase and P-loop NTPases
MEVIGIITAIPGLVELVTGSIKLVRACTDKNTLTKATKGLDVQLSLLAEILTGIDERWRATSLSSDQLTWLGPVLKELREELASLNSMLAKASRPDRGLGFIGKVKLALHGFESDVTTHIQRIESIKSLLILKATNDIHATISGTNLHVHTHSRTSV